jgi:prepilin-type processing-associated H-X9-DG protein
MYTQDFDEKYPPAQSEGNRHGIGWADLLLPYHKRTTRLYQCPTEGGSSSGSPSASDYTDYWFNANMARQDQSSLANPAWTLWFGDGNDGVDSSDASYSISGLPLRWLSGSNSPAFRHFTGANYAYADGHVKFTRPADITDNAPHPRQPTFAIK